MVISRPLSDKNRTHLLEGTIDMAKCANCGKVPVVGKNVSHAKNRTPRLFRPNLQKVSVLEKGKLVQKTLCAKCIKSFSKIS